MKLAKEADVPLVTAILEHEDVWPYLHEDGNTLSPSDVAVMCIGNPSVYTLLPNEWTVFFFLPRGAVTYELHSAILPEGRGATSLKAVNEAFLWMYGNTACRKIMTWVPVCNERAVRAGKHWGFGVEGFLSSSWKKNGVLYGQYLLGKER